MVFRIITPGEGDHGLRRQILDIQVGLLGARVTHWKHGTGRMAVQLIKSKDLAGLGQMQGLRGTFEERKSQLIFKLMNLAARPNGPLVPELKEMFPDAPYIARPGNINAWDNEDFLKAVKATGKKQLIIAGIVTEVCVAFPALSALEEGYEVFIVTDASGTFNKVTREAAWNRMSAAGAQLMTWFAMACELHRDWRNDVEGLGTLFSNHLPIYRCLINSYMAHTSANQGNR